MNEQECLSKMVPPSQRRPQKAWGGGGVMQIMITRACDKSCYGCTQGSNLAGKPAVMSVDDFDVACNSLKGYPFLVGVFGGNPCLHPQFDQICDVLRHYFPKEKCGLWSNNINGHGASCRKTFRPDMSNLNVHLDMRAYEEIYGTWPEARRYIKGHDRDSRHSPPFVAMKDVVLDESKRWDLISKCDINQDWSALIGVTTHGLRGYFCEIAYAQAALHPEWPDTGLDVEKFYVSTQDDLIAVDVTSRLGVRWWQLPMKDFAAQVRLHCHSCGVPLSRKGELACAADGTEEVSETHANIFKPKVKGRRVSLVTVDSPPVETLRKMTHYLENSKL